jgi:hypothetical protein
MYVSIPFTFRTNATSDANIKPIQAAWDPTTPFTTAIGPLGPHSGLRVLSFRTCKADTVVSLPAGKDEELQKEYPGGGSGGREWAWSGKWAVVSFCDGKV